LLKRVCFLMVFFLLFGKSWAMYGLSETSMEEKALLHFRRAQTFIAYDMPENALKEYQLALHLKPESGLSAAVYNDLGLLYRKLGMPEKAIVSFQLAMALNPSFEVYFNNWADCFREEKTYQQVASQLERALQKNPENTLAWYQLGVLYQQHGQLVKAKRCFARYNTLNPGSILK
jgi:tetratricopeptide (TPR) repeat protein